MGKLRTYASLDACVSFMPKNARASNLRQGLRCTRIRRASRSSSVVLAIRASPVKTCRNEKVCNRTRALFCTAVHARPHALRISLLQCAAVQSRREVRVVRTSHQCVQELGQLLVLLAQTLPEPLPVLALLLLARCLLLVPGPIVQLDAHLERRPCDAPPHRHPHVNPPRAV